MPVGSMGSSSLPLLKKKERRAARDHSLAPGSDFMAALAELQGRALRLEIAGESITKILPPLRSEAAE